MAAFRYYDPNPVHFDNDGAVCSGGSLYFYETGTTTPKATYSDYALTTPNANPMTLDADGRIDGDVFMDGIYRVVLKDSGGSTIWTKDSVTSGAGGAGQEIPAGTADYFLTTDGANLSWAAVLQVPDPTGNSTKVLSNDGTNLTWVDRPADGAAGAAGTSDVTQTSTTFSVNDMFVRTGSATGTSAGGRTQTVNVTFATAFTSTPVYIDCSLTGSTYSSFGNIPSPQITSKSTTGFTVVWTMGELDDSQSGYNFNAGVSFDWIAIGVDTAS